MFRRLARPRAAAFAVAAAAFILGPTQVAGSAPGDPPVFSGQATAVDATVNVPVLGTQHIVLGDTGRFNGPAFDGTSGVLSVGVSPSQTGGILGLNGDVITSSTMTEGDHVDSQTDVVQVSGSVNGIPIAADVLHAEAHASCGANGPVLTGTASVLGVQVGTVTVPVTPPPNTTIPIPGTNGFVVINEQHSTGNAIDVTALHIVLPGVADVAIANAHADVLCQGGAPNCGRARFVTGGGWIASGNSRGNFAVAARDGVGTWGHVLYKDHFTGKSYRGTPSFAAIDATKAVIDGTLDNGHSFEAVVQDLGEPGSSDTFTLSMDQQPVNGGTLQGGNIQIHRPCSSK
jgi:hypothetical protein